MKVFTLSKCTVLFVFDEDMPAITWRAKVDARRPAGGGLMQKSRQGDNDGLDYSGSSK